MYSTLAALLPMDFSKGDDIDSLAGAFMGIRSKKGGKRPGKKPPKDNMPLILGILLMITIAIMLIVVIKYSG